MIIELIIILLLLVANGAFAMTEMAIVSSRKMKLRQLAEQGDSGARAALNLAESPNRFLPAVQIGITLIGLLAGAFGGVTIAEHISNALRNFSPLAPYAHALGVGTVVVALTFFSLVIGELVPKRIALSNPEAIAKRMARPLDWLSRIARPAIRILAMATDLVLAMLRIEPVKKETVSDEEVKFLLQEGMEAGVFHRAEPRMVESVLSFDKRPARDIMTPREKIVFLNRNDPHEAIWHKVVVSGYSNYPVYEDKREHVVGIVSLKSIYANLAAGTSVRLADLMTPPLTVEGGTTVTELLEQFKTSGKHVALVYESSRLAGIITLVDVLEAIVGEIPSLEDRLKPTARKREGNAWLVDGRYPLAKLSGLTGDRRFIAEAVPGCETVEGFLKAGLNRAPVEGAMMDWEEWRFEVIDMDHERIDKVLLLGKPDVDTSGNGGNI